MQNKSQKVVAFLIRRRWFVLSGMAVIWVLLLLSATGIHLDEDILALLPENEQMAGYRTLLNEFNPMNAVLISVSDEDNIGGNRDTLIRVADSLHRQLQATGYFTKIIYRWSIQDFQKSLAVLKDHRQMLFTKADSAEIAQRIQFEAIAGRLKEWKKTLAETPSPMLAGQMVEDPLGFNDILLNKLNQSQAVNSDTEIYKGRIFNATGDHLLLVAYPEISSMESGKSETLVAGLNNLFTGLEAESGLNISWVAAHRFSVENARRIKGDLQLTVSVALLAIVLLSLLVYTRPALMFFTLLPALFGSAFSLGILHWINPNISAIIIGTGAMLIGIAVDYGIHFLFHADQMTEPFDAENLSGLLSRISRPLLMSAGTTVFAFFALQFSGMPAYTQLGWFVSLGIAGAVMFVIFVFPVILSLMKRIVKRRAILNPGLFIREAIIWISQKKRFVISALILLSIILIPGLMHLQFDGDVQKLNSVSPEIRRDMDELTGAFGNVMTSTLIMIQSPDAAAALKGNEELSHFLNGLQQRRLVSEVSGISHLLPAKESQHKNQLRWQTLFNETEIQSLKNNLDEAAQKIGFRAGIFDPFIADLMVKNTSIDSKTYENTIIENILTSMLKSDARRTNVLTTVALANGGNFETIRAELKHEFPDAIIYNGQHFVEQTIRLILSELERVGLIALVFVVVILLLFTRSIKRTLILLIPLFLSMVWTFGILGWLGIKVNIINSIISVFIFGLVIDYCIFLSSVLIQSSAGKSDQFMVSAGGSITISAATTIIGIGVLVFAQHPALFTLGLTASIGILSGYLCTILIIPLFYKSGILVS